MEQTTQQTITPSPKSKNILIVVALIIVVLLALVWWWQTSSVVTEEQQPVVDVESGTLATTSMPFEDTTPVIQQDLQGINDINLDEELKSINADLNNL